VVNFAAACLRRFRLAKVGQTGTTRHDSSCRTSEKQERTPEHHKNGMETFNRIAPDVSLGRSVKIFGFANLYGCTVGDESRIGCFVEIQKNATVGARCKISSHSFICEGVTIEDDVFIGHHVCFINDLFPRACRPDGTLQTNVDWKVIPILVERRGAVAIVTINRPEKRNALNIQTRAEGAATRCSSLSPRRRRARKCAAT